MSFCLLMRAGRAIAASAALLSLASIGHAADFSVTNTADTGTGSLRAAINLAAANPGPDNVLINVTGQVLLTRSINFSDTNAVVISGSTAKTFILNGGAVDRVLTVGSGSLLINGITIINGRSNDDSHGGGISVFGGTLELRDCAVVGNVAPEVAGSQVNGGAVHTNTGTTFVARRCLFANNVAQAGSGGAIRSNGSLVLENCTLTGNAATQAGAISFQNVVGPTATIEACTISGNVASLNAGGIKFGPAVNFIHNTIVAGNASPLDPDVRGVVGSVGHNLVGVVGASTGWGATDLLNVNPLLGPLWDNGGPTQTMALLLGSPAWNAADPNSFPPVDQRGVARPQNLLPDIGAFEAIVEINEAPTADAGPDQSLTHNGSPVSVTLDGTGSSDPDGDTLTYTWYDASDVQVGTGATLALSLGVGSHTFKLVVEDEGGLKDDDTVVIDVVAANVAPTADAGDDQSFAFTGSNVSVTLDGTGSSDPEGGALQYTWYDKNDNVVATSATASLSLGAGIHVFRLVVEDEGGLTDEDEVTVRVTESGMPAISGASVSLTELWPPNHRMVTIGVRYTATDDYDQNLTVWLTVKSSEADFGLGDGDLPHDIQVVDAHTVKLRAERYAKAGRIYTITIHAMDDSGNEARKTLIVKVPHDNGKK